MTDNSILEDGEMINSAEAFNTVIERMKSEGEGGLLKAELFTPSDAARFLVGNLLSRGNYLDNMHFMECDKFLIEVEKTKPLCSGRDCNNEMNTYTDVGAIVIVHGICDRPTTVIVAGVCNSCWIQKFERDKEKALAGFIDWLSGALPDMQTYKSEDLMEGNAPSSRAVN